MLDTKEFLPEKLKGNLLEDLSEIFDDSIQDFVDIVEEISNKNKDVAALSNDAIDAIFDELGFGYIKDVLVAAQFDRQDMGKLVGLIQVFKGNKTGLELVLDLVQATRTITEWWEKSPQGNPATYDISIEINLEEYSFDLIVVFDILNKIDAFLPQYVYPIAETKELIAFTEVTGSTPSYGMGLAGGEEVTIYPEE